jgi:hypothetical protein
MWWDVVVSKPTDKYPGVVQYDYGKTLPHGVFRRTGFLNKPPGILLTALSNLQANHRLGVNSLTAHLEAAAEKYPSMRSTFVYPGCDQDILFEASYLHLERNPSCADCDYARMINRQPRQPAEPHIHYGLASANGSLNAYRPLLLMQNYVARRHHFDSTAGQISLTCTARPN